MVNLTGRENLVDIIVDNLIISRMSKLSCHPSLKRALGKVVFDIMQTSNVNKHTLPQLGGRFIFNGRRYFVEMRPHNDGFWQLRVCSRPVVDSRYNPDESVCDGVGFISDKVIRQLQGVV